MSRVKFEGESIFNSKNQLVTGYHNHVQGIVVAVATTDLGVETIGIMYAQA